MIGRRSKLQVNKVRQQVYARDHYGCIVRGSIWQHRHPCGGEITIQHAVTRGMGSSAKWDGVDYLRTMCAVHNVLDASAADFRQACIENGWSVPRWVAEQTPTNKIPVHYPDGWYLLHGGERIRISDRAAMAFLDELYPSEVE